jgi:mRNA interferase RelE/StbE
VTEIAIGREAQKALERLPPDVADAIEAKIEQLAREPRSLANMVKKLKGRPVSRLRVGEWRVLFRFEGGVLHVSAIAHRREVYR